MSRDLFFDDAAALSTNTSAEHYRIQDSFLQLLRVLTAVFVVGLGISCIISIGWWYFAFSHFGPAAVWRWSSVALYASLLFILLTIICSVSLIRLNGFSLSLSEENLSVHQGNQIQIFPWDQIKYIRTAKERYWLPISVLGTRSTIWLDLESGTMLRYSDTLERFDDFVETVKSKVYPQLLERYRILLNQGQAIDFGKLVIEPTGIRVKRKDIPWSTLEGISLERGKVILRTRKQGRSKEIVLPASRIYNVDLCVQLIQNIELTS